MRAAQVRMKQRRSSRSPAPTPIETPVETPSRARRWLWLLASAAAATGLLAVAGGNAWFTPYQFGDDLVFDVQGWSYTEEKVRGEARWLVWAWHKVIGTNSVVTDFRLAVAAWCAASALLAQRLTRRAPALMLVCTVALAVSPGAMRMVQWPHTELPMMVTLAVGLLLLDVSSREDTSRDTRSPGDTFRVRARRAGQWRGVLIAVMCAVAMLAFQLFSLLLIAAAMMIAAIDEVREAEWNATRLVRTLASIVLWGAAGSIVGLLIGFSLNWFAFGFFGLDIATWRIDAAPAGNRVPAALQSVMAILVEASRLSAHLLLPVMLSAIGSWVWLARRRTGGAQMIAVLLVLTAGIVLAPGVVTLLSGASVPPDRSALNVWFATVAWIVLLAESVRPAPRALVTGGLAAFAALGLWSSGGDLSNRSEVRQAYDRHLDRIASDVRREVGKAGRARLLIAVGDTTPFPELGTRRAWWVRALLRSRLEPELVSNAVYCPTVAGCRSLGAPTSTPLELEMPAYPAPGYLLRSEDVLLIRFDDKSSGHD